MKSLHQQVRAKAQHGRVILAQLGPNSRDVAKGMIARGELVKARCGHGYVLNGS